MRVSLHPTMPTRPCRFCLCLQDGAVFSDWDVDDAGRVRLVRISYDGYGCCSAPTTIDALGENESSDLLAAVARGDVSEPAVADLLRRYFRQHAALLWAEALESHGLT